MAMRTHLVLLALCALLRTSLSQCPLPPTPLDNICAVLGLTSTTSSEQACQAITVLEKVAEAGQPLRCRSNTCAGIRVPPKTDRHGTAIPQELPDVRPLNAGLPSELDYAKFAAEEGGTYYWYWRNLLTFTNWAPCTLPRLGNADADDLPLPGGWDTADVFNMPPPPGTLDTLPIAALIKRDPSYGHERCRHGYVETAHYDASQRPIKHSMKGHSYDDNTKPYSGDVADKPQKKYHADEPGLAKQYPKQDMPYGAEEYDHQQYKAPEYRHDKPYIRAPAKEQYRKQYKEETHDNAYGSKGPKEEQYYKTSEKHSYHSKHRQQYRHKPHSPSEEPYKQYVPSRDKHYSKYKPSGPEYDSHEDADDRYDEESDHSCVKYEGSSPHLVLLIRGTLTEPEWGADLAYNQVSDPAFGPGKFSFGFYSVALTIWRGGLEAAVQREIAAGRRSITVAGFSLGAAVAQLLAVRIEALLAEARQMDDDEPHYDGDYAPPAPVMVVTFGAPTTGDPAWTSNFNAKINARNIAFKGDLITKVPCVPQIVGCSAPPVLIATNQTGNPWKYSRPGAQMVFPGSAVPFTSLTNPAQDWSSLEALSGGQLCGGVSVTGLSLVQAGSAGHICSYNCWLSKFVGEENNLCWLDDDESAPEGATRCPLGDEAGGTCI